MRQDISPDMVVQALLRDGVLGFRDKGAFCVKGFAPTAKRKACSSGRRNRGKSCAAGK